MRFTGLRGNSQRGLVAKPDSCWHKARGEDLDPYKTPRSVPPKGGEYGNCMSRRAVVLLHSVGLGFLLMSSVSWFLIWDYAQLASVQSNSAYQVLSLSLVLGFFAFVPFVSYCFFFCSRIGRMSVFEKLMTAVYTFPLIAAWATAISVYP